MYDLCAHWRYHRGRLVYAYNLLSKEDGLIVQAVLMVNMAGVVMLCSSDAHDLATCMMHSWTHTS